MAIELTEGQRTLLEGKHFGTIATVTPQGVPSQVLVWYMLTGSEIVITTQDTSFKVRNIEKTGWASLSVADGPKFITVRGRATVDHDRATVEPTRVQIVTRYVGPEDAEKWIATMSRGNEFHSVIIHIPVEHVMGAQA